MPPHRAASLSLCLLILVVAASAAIWSKSEKANATGETKTPTAAQTFWYNDVTKESRWVLPEYEFKSGKSTDLESLKCDGGASRRNAECAVARSVHTTAVQMLAFLTGWTL